MGLSDGERISMIRSAVLIQYTRVTDRQTDGIGVAYALQLCAVAREKVKWGNIAQWLNIKHMIKWIKSISKSYIQGGPKKTDCFWELITLRRLVVEKRVICQNLANFIQKRIYNLHTSALNILCLICINIQCPWNYAEFDYNARFYSNFHPENSETTTFICTHG